MRILQIRPTPPLRLRYAAASLRKATTQPASDHGSRKTRKTVPLGAFLVHGAATLKTVNELVVLSTPAIDRECPIRTRHFWYGGGQVVNFNVKSNLSFG